MKWLEVLLEIIKVTVPALIVYFTVHKLLKEYFNKEITLKRLEQRKEVRDTTLPLRLQAYERLALFCERIKIQNLIIRLQGTSVNAQGLHQSMMIIIKQEYDHNLSQQVYVSEDLWKIITIAHNRTIADISTVARNLSKDAGPDDLAKALFDYLDSAKETPLDIALSAIKKEAVLLLT